MKKAKLFVGLALTALMGITGCNKQKPDPKPGPEPEPGPVSVDVTMNKTALTLLRKESGTIAATSSDNSNITFTTSNVNVKLSKTVAASGEEITVTAMNVGTTTITATSGSGSATCVVTINADGVHTHHDYLGVSPSNWNELTYQDANDTNIMGYIGGSFFTFNYAFDEKGEIIDGGFQVQYDGVKELEDVTEEYAGDPDYKVPEDATKGYAYKFTLRDDLKWDDGTAIHASDFVYTMQELLNPDFQNYRADTMYNGDTVVHNAQSYLKQGQSGIFNSKGVFGGVYDSENDSQLIFKNYPTSTYEEQLGENASGYQLGENIYFIDWFLGNYPSYAPYAAYGAGFLMEYLFEFEDVTEEAVLALEGKTLAEIKADPTMKATWDAIIGNWQTDPGEELDFWVTDYTFPAVSEDELGLFVGDSENELVIVLDKVLNLFKDDGSLSYQAAYNFSSLPLVKEDLYEANKVEPALEGGLWTSKYNSDVASTASWGPYKLTEFQAGKQYKLERNPNWYGYNMAEYAGQYETDVIVVDIIEEWNTAFLAFQQGQLDAIGIDVSVAADYKNSSRAVFTGDDYVDSLQLQSSATALKGREEEGIDKEMLLYQDFRQALSLSIDRDLYANTCTTASLKGLGLFNSMHYYDVENAGVYRNTDIAKRVICEVYGVNVEDYDSLDEAYQAVTGYNINLAREKLVAAYNAALTAGTINETDVVKLTYGSSIINETVQRRFDFYANAFATLAEGTPLEGRIVLEIKPFGDNWAKSFRDGGYDICAGGWSGAAWNPGYMMGAYVLKSNRYAQGWDAEHTYITYNPFGDGDAEHEYTMSIIDWYNCLNGVEGCAHNWSKGEVEEEVRLGILGEMEKCVLKTYYTVPVTYWYTASLLSYRVEYGSRTYNTFMGYGGLRYLTYNYNDAEWEAYLADHSPLDYRD